MVTLSAHTADTVILWTNNPNIYLKADMKRTCKDCGGDYIVSCDEASNEEEQHKVNCGQHWHCEDCGLTWLKTADK